MRLQGPARRMTIYVGESDHFHHRPLYAEIVHRAHECGLAGASVIRGIEGFGGHRHVHTSRLLSLAEDLPILVTIVDRPERLESFLPQLDEILTEALVVLEDVEVIAYRRDPS